MIHKMKPSSFIIAVLLATLLVTGCGSTGKTATLGKEFSLSVGESVLIRGENLEITFLKVVEDSRCPTGVQCIWEGRARSLVSFVSNNKTEVELTEPGLTDSPYQYTFRDYWIIFHLLPYPEAGKEITADQYRLLMSVSKLK
jgi:hypothetical protein